MILADGARKTGPESLRPHTPVKVQVRTERVSCRWRAEDRYRCREEEMISIYMYEATGRKLRHQGVEPGIRGREHEDLMAQKALPSGL